MARFFYRLGVNFAMFSLEEPVMFNRVLSNCIFVDDFCVIRFFLRVFCEEGAKRIKIVPNVISRNISFFCCLSSRFELEIGMNSSGGGDNFCLVFFRYVGSNEYVSIFMANVGDGVRGFFEHLLYMVDVREYGFLSQDVSGEDFTFFLGACPPISF